MIQVSADTGAAVLSVTPFVCQTNAASQCVNPTLPSTNVTGQINAFQTPTFAVFIQAHGSMPFSPGVNRGVLAIQDPERRDRRRDQHGAEDHAMSRALARLSKGLLGVVLGWSALLAGCGNALFWQQAP